MLRHDKDKHFSSPVLNSSTCDVSKNPSDINADFIESSYITSTINRSTCLQPAPTSYVEGFGIDKNGNECEKIPETDVDS